MDRRTVLRLMGGAAAALAGPGLGRALSVAAAELPYTVLGFSQGGTPLVVFHLGSGDTRLFVLGGQHGGPEHNTIVLAGAILDYYTNNLDQIPAGAGLDVLVVANPDGDAIGSRLFLSGVDPNRNWGSSDWQSDTYASNGVFRVGLGGPRPFSEQETRALRDWLLKTRPFFTINYHSIGGFVFGQSGGRIGDLVQAYVDASGYYHPASGGASRVLGYRTSGTMSVWQREQNLGALFVELGSFGDPELDQNMAGLRAVIARLV